VRARGLIAGVACACGAALAVGSSVAVLGLLTEYPALGGQAVRYALAAALLAAVAVASRRGLPAICGRDALQLAALAATGLVAFNLLVFGALEEAEPSAVGVVVGCAPIVLALAGPLLARRAPVARVVAAALVVTVGAAVVQGVGDATLAGLLLSLGALAGEALFSLLAVSLLPRLGPLVLSTYVCAMAAAALGVTAVLVDGAEALPLPSTEEAAAIAYLAVVVTASAFVAWYSGVQRLGVERAGLFAGLIPVSTMLCAAAIGTGSLGLVEALGVLVVGAGVSFGVSALPQPEGRRSRVSRSSVAASALLHATSSPRARVGAARWSRALDDRRAPADRQSRARAAAWPGRSARDSRSPVFQT
jgi:drug/metabolite transporter (DMT)-like permease